MKYIVVGGAGAMGRITVKDLLETADRSAEIVIADYDAKKAQEVADSFESARVGVVQVDVKDPASCKRAFDGATVLVNSVQYQLNLHVMEAALAVGAHYCDIGGLFHMTRKQMELHERFKFQGLTAVLGVGAAPGITNILSRACADKLDTVTEIHTRVGGTDMTRYEPKPALAVSYSLKTILEEFSFEPAVFTRGEFKFVKPMSGDHPHRFPPPVGTKRPMYTIHSEVATLPLSFKSKGVKEVSFKIAFDETFLDRVRFLRDLGFASHNEIEVAGTRVKPVDVANYVAMHQTPARQLGKLKQYEVVRAVVKGVSKGKKVTWIADCHTRGIEAWGLGIDVDTGCPPSIIAQMIAQGQISERGVLAPEVAVPVEPFFKELKRRKMTVKMQRRAGWGLSV